MASVFILIISLSFIYTLFLQIFSMDKKRVTLFSKSLFVASIIGALSCIVSFILYYVHIKALDNAELYGAVCDAFSIFAFPVYILSAAIVLITTTVYFIGKKSTSLIPSVCHSASLLVLLFALICASWSHYEEIPLNVYINFVGCSLSLLLMLPASLALKHHSKRLEDKDYIYNRLHRHDNRLQKAEERKRIKETKNRIKNKTKK